MDELISRQEAIDAIESTDWYHIKDGELVHGANSKEDEPLYKAKDIYSVIENLPSVHPEKHTEERAETHSCDLIDRQAAIDALGEGAMVNYQAAGNDNGLIKAINVIKGLPSSQADQRYTEEELRVFAHGISLSLLSKRSAQHWRYDEDTATEIKFLERLYEKVGADMRGEQDERD